MKMMPKLEIDKTYTWEDLTGFIDEGDRKDACLPQSFIRKGLWRQGKVIFLEYTEVQSDVLSPQIASLRSMFSRDPDHWSRVEEIKKKLEDGKTAFPLFFIKEDKEKEIIAGMHRAVGFMELEAPYLPVLMLKFADW